MNLKKKIFFMFFGIVNTVMAGFAVYNHQWASLIFHLLIAGTCYYYYKGIKNQEKHLEKNKG